MSLQAVFDAKTTILHVATQLSIVCLPWQNILIHLFPTSFFAYWFSERETCQKEMEGQRLAKIRVDKRKKEEDFGESTVGRIRTYLWNLTEYPETSYGARVSDCTSLVTVHQIQFFSCVHDFQHSIVGDGFHVSGDRGDFYNNIRPTNHPGVRGWGSQISSGCCCFGSNRYHISRVLYGRILYKVSTPNFAICRFCSRISRL